MLRQCNIVNRRKLLSVELCTSRSKRSANTMAREFSDFFILLVRYSFCSYREYHQHGGGGFCSFRVDHCTSWTANAGYLNAVVA